MAGIDEDTSKVLRGAKAIGRAIGCSESTIRRMHVDGNPHLYKLRSGTSPITVRRADLPKLLRPQHEGRDDR
jgi:hypothetical protein